MTALEQVLVEALGGLLDHVRADRPESGDRQYEEILKQLAHLNGKVDQVAVTQADIDALAQQINQRDADLADAFTKVSAEIQALQDANPGLDITGLQAAASDLDAKVASVVSLEPATTDQGGVTPTGDGTTPAPGTPTA